MGLGLCITSIGDAEKQTCCSYWFQPVGAKTSVCTQNCPLPYFSSPDTSAGACVKRSKLH